MSAASPLLTLPQLLACATALMILMGALTWFLLRQDQVQHRLLGRIDTIATPYARANGLNTMGRRRAARSGEIRLRAAGAALFGYDPARSAHYPVRGLVVLGVSLLVAIVLSYVANGLVGPMARLAAPGLWVGASRFAFGWFEQRRTGRLYSQFPDALAMIVRAVRVGIPVSEAVRNVSREALEPTADEFALLSDQVAIGVALDEALRDMATRNRLPEYRFFATALSLQAQTGGGLSETLENLAEVIRKRVAVRNRARALASEARTSTYVLAALPVFTGMALGFINPKYIGVLFTDPTGRGVLAAAIGMLGTGMLVMRMTISRSLR